MVHCLVDANGTDFSVYDEYEGGFYHPTAYNKRFQRVMRSSGNWGDDSKIKITTSGSDTFVDLNGNTCLSTVHELSIPCGFTKNAARAGTQVEGVDL